MVSSRFRAVLSAVIVATLAAQAHAQAPTPSNTWTNFVTASTQWGNANNWNPAGPPVNGIDTVLGFGSSTLQTAGGYSTTNNQGTFNLNAMVFTSAAASNPSLIVTNSTAADTINFNVSSTGTLPSIWQNGTGRVLFQNGTSTAGLTITNTTLRILGDGIGELQLGVSGAANALTIAEAGGAGSLLINQTGTRTLYSGSIVRIGATNNTTGGVTLTSGNLLIANNAALGSGTFTVNGGSVQFDTAATTGFTISNPIALNTSMVLTGANYATTVPNPVATFSGTISGNGGLIVNPISSVNFDFTGSNTFAGPVNNSPIGNAVTTLSFGNATVSTGTLSGANALTVTSNSSITLNNTAGVLTRLNTTTAPTLTLNRGNFNLRGNSSANASETFSTLTLNGTGSIAVTGASATLQTTTLNFSGATPLNRGTFGTGTLALTATNLGSGSGAGESIITFQNNPGGAIGGGGSPGTPTVSLLPYMYVDSGANTTTASVAPVFSFTRWDSTSKRIVPLNQTTEYASNLYLTGTTAPTANQRLASTSGLPSAFGVAGLSQPTTINALVLDTNTTATNRIGLSLEGSSTLTVTSGGILVGINGGTGASSLPSMINLGGLNFGSNPGTIHTVNSLVVNSPISGTGGLIKSAFGTLTLNGTNTFTGGLNSNSGIIQFNSDANLGAAGQPINLNGGLTAAFTFVPNNLFTAANFSTATVNRPINVGPTGTNITVSLTNNTLTLPGVISGTGQIMKSGSGILNLTGTNTFTGNLVLLNGTITVANDAALGAPSSVLVQAGGTLQPTASFTSSRDWFLTGTPVIFTNGNNLTVSGNITSQNANFGVLKDGAGDLILTGVNTFLGGYQNGISGPGVRGTASSSALTAGRTILNGPNGSMPLAASALSIANGEIVLDNSAAVNNNRLGTVTLGVIGGNARLIGNASAPVTESIGVLSHSNGNNPYGGVLTLETPAGSGQSTTLNVTGVSAAANIGVVFVRGTNLGAGTGDRTALISATAVPLSNTVITTMVGATSPTSEPTDFLTTQTITNPAPNNNQFAIVPYTAYTPASGFTGSGSATLTYDVNAAVTGLTGPAIAANALKINAGGSVDIGAGNTLTLTAGNLLAAGGANSGITNGTLAFGANVARVTVATGSDLTINSVITGSAGFVKAGGGTLTVNQPSTVTNATVGVGQGTLKYGVANSFPITSNVFVNAGATLDLNSTTSTVATIQGYGNVNLGSGSLTMTSATAPVVAYGGSFIGTAASSLIKTNTNTVTVAGTSPSFTGSVQILNRTLAVNSNTAIGSGPVQIGDPANPTNLGILALGTTVTSFSNPITIPAASTPTTIGTTNFANTISSTAAVMTLASNIQIDSTFVSYTSGGYTATGVGLQFSGSSGGATGSTTQTGVIAGAGGLLVFAGNWAFNGNNTYSGGTFFDTSTTTAAGIGIDSTPTTGTVTSGPFGTGPVAFSTGFGINLRADGGPRTIANEIRLSNTGGYFGVTGTNNLTLNGPFDLQGAAGAQSLVISSTGRTTINGTIQNGTGGLNKNGPGLLVLTANNTYAGGTNVNAGTLLANNTTGSATGTDPVTVNSGAILGGTGTIAGAVTVAAPAGVIAPGNLGVGTLTLNSDLNLNGIMTAEVTNSPSADRINVGGNLTLGAGSVLNLPATNTYSPVVYSLISYTGTLTGTFGSVNNLPSGYFVGYGTVITNTITLSPVPEPAAMLLVCGSAAGVVWMRRRRNKTV